MPIWARVFSALFGGSLFFGGLLGAVAIRPFDYQTATVCIGAMVPGMVLIASGLSGYWPLFIA